MRRAERAIAEDQLWGIYHSDADHARHLGNPLRTVVHAPTQITAEEAAARLGFGDAHAKPVTPDEAQAAQWLPGRTERRRQDSACETCRSASRARRTS